ncbi:MAG: Maf-like protein, partial [Planctomycetales bacterium]|nr:Maf-like protein [Planctomycetales bacterium]
YQKARDVALQQASGWILGCDTVAECCGQILGKPTDREHARQMLQLLQGHQHRVFSGLCLWHRPSNRMWGDVDVSELTMDRQSDSELERYLDSEQWQGKAGAFGYQDGLDWVHLVSGSESNVVGLPLEKFARLWQKAQTELAQQQAQQQ